MLIFAKWLISLVWGGGSTVTSILAEIDKTRVQLANTGVEQEKVELQGRLDTLHALLGDAANARASASALPWWMAFIADMIGTPISLHIGMIALATTFQPLLVGGWLDWMLRIPPLPLPFDTYEANIVGYFFGFGAAIGSVSAIASSIARHK